MTTKQIMISIMLALSLNANAQLQTDSQYTSTGWKNLVRKSPDSFFATAEARRVGDLVLLYQRKWGGWPKNHPMNKPLVTKEDSAIINPELDDCTIDNNATVLPMTYLARLYQATKDEKYKNAFMRGVEYLLASQYQDCGGWPQFWPNADGYRPHITYNDNAMVNAMKMIRDVNQGKKPYQGLADDALKARLKKAFDKGVECILNTQIVVDGKPTVWCQQHDHITLKPAKARAYELPSFCSQESVEILKLLMSLPNPDKRVMISIAGAKAWLEAHKLTGIRVERFVNNDGQQDVRVVQDKNAKPIWARYYDLQTQQPFFCDRNGKPVKTLAEVGLERRAGYSWYNDEPASILEKKK